MNKMNVPEKPSVNPIVVRADDAAKNPRNWKPFPTLFD